MKNMVTRDRDLTVRFVGTEPGFYNGDDIRIVYFNKYTEFSGYGLLVKFSFMH